MGIRILVDYITFEKMSTIVFNRTSSFLQRAISGSWDNTVKFWQATPTGLKEGRRALNLKVRKENSFGVCFYTRLNQVAVLSIDILGDRVAAATYDKKVTLIHTHILEHTKYTSIRWWCWTEGRVPASAASTRFTRNLSLLSRCPSVRWDNS